MCLSTVALLLSLYIMNAIGYNKPELQKAACGQDRGNSVGKYKFHNCRDRIHSEVKFSIACVLRE